MLVDYARAWLRLKAYVDSKPSHGRDGLHLEMTRIEISCEVAETEEGFDPTPMRRADDPRDLEERPLEVGHAG